MTSAVNSIIHGEHVVRNLSGTRDENSYFQSDDSPQKLFADLWDIDSDRRAISPNNEITLSDALFYQVTSAVFIPWTSIALSHFKGLEIKTASLT